jgi:meiotic recombination protein SPO11
MFVLVDFDPHGIAIMRTYKYGSQRLEHEQDATAPRLRWLGILSDDVLFASSNPSEVEDYNQTQISQGSSSQDSVAFLVDGGLCYQTFGQSQGL